MYAGLSRILKYTLDEFAGLEIEDIIRCMSEPQISTVSMEPGYTNMAKIQKTSEEDSVLGEGRIYYDIRFNVILGEEMIKILRKNENAEKSKNKLIVMLEELLKKEPVSEKKKKLSDEYGIIMSEETERRLNTMCNLSEVVLEKGIEQGIEQGEEKMAVLMQKLFADKRVADAEKASRDASYRAELLKEYSLEK